MTESFGSYTSDDIPHHGAQRGHRLTIVNNRYICMYLYVYICTFGMSYISWKRIKLM